MSFTCRKKAMPIIKKLSDYFDERLEKFVGLALSMTTKLRWLITTKSEHPSLVVEFILERIPEQHRVAAATALATAISTFAAFKECHADTTKLDELVRCYVSVLKKLPKEIQDSETIKLASIATRWMDNRYYTHIYDTAVQLKVTEMILNEND